MNWLFEGTNWLQLNQDSIKRLALLDITFDLQVV